MDLKKELEDLYRKNKSLLKKEKEISSFISQFPDDEVWVPLKLLHNFKYIDDDLYEDMLIEMYNRVQAMGFDSPIYVGLGFAAESGVKMATDFRRANNHLPTSSFINYTQWEQFDFSGIDSVVFFDDVVGSGKQACAFLYEKLHGKIANKVFVYFSLVATKTGIKRIKNNFPDIEVETLIEVEEGEIFFEGNIFTNYIEAKDVCTKWGGKLDEKRPLGFNDGALLIAFSDNTPNNTLPIFWNTRNGWKAPFPRKQKKTKTLNISRPTEVGIMSSTKLDLHGFIVEDIAKLQRFNPPLSKGQLFTKISHPKELPKEIVEYYDTEYDNRIKQLESGGKKVTINKGYSVQQIKIEKNDGINSHERDHSAELTFEFADYSHQIMFGERIHEKGLINYQNRKISISEYAKETQNIEFENFDWPDVLKMPVRQRGANVLALRVPVDKSAAAVEKCIIIPLRSKSVFVQDSSSKEDVWQASLSCAEGMLRPADALSQNEALPPTPFNTVSRALTEELGLAPEEFSENDLKLLGIAYDSNRCQPVCVFILESNSLDARDIYNRWKGDAIDSNENKDLISVPTNENDYAEFLLGNKRYKDKKVELFSNHQKIGAALVGEYLFGGSLKNLQLNHRKTAYNKTN